MERIRNCLSRRWLLWVAIAALAATGSAPTIAAAQATVTVRVVDQDGTELNGSVVQMLGSDTEWTTPATVTIDPGFQVFVVSPAFQGAMFAGGSARPTANNDLRRTIFAMVDGSSPTLDLAWQTSLVTMSVVDQDGAAIPGALWGFDGEGAFYAPGTVTAPINDPNVYPDLAGSSAGAWHFAVQAGFAGAAVDLFHADTRVIGASTSALAFEWRQVSCNMGVVDGTEAALRGATWSMLGHTFAEGDAITLPVTDVALYPSLSGALATGFPTTLATNTASGTGAGTFTVAADGSLAPAFVTVGGAPFGLRCGVSAPPPITTGTLAGVVTKDGVPYAGAVLSVVDAASAAHAAATNFQGAFTVTDLPAGAVTVTLTVPAGTHPVDPAGGQLTAQIVAEKTTNVSFSLATDATPPPLVDNPETRDYWWHNAKSAQKGNGKHEESFADMRTNFPQAIFDQFANAATDPVRVQGVTQVDPDGTGPMVARRLTVDDLTAGLDPGHPSNLADARSELLVILLNVVSDRLSLDLVVDAQGTTLAQEIRILAAMINDGATANDVIAKGRAHAINSGYLSLRSSAGFGRDGSLEGGASSNVTPATTDLAPTVASLRATRQADTSVHFAIAMPQASNVTLDLYDVTGRHVTRLWEGTAPVGITNVSWSHGGVRAGMYFARMISSQGALAAKVLVTR